MCNKIKWYEDNFLKKDTTILEKDQQKQKKEKRHVDVVPMA